MFWINSAVIESLKSLKIPTIQADSEKNWTDSTWAHGLERVVGQIVINGGRGYQWKRSELQE
jgi:lipopolysaccharide biosynthesis protein